MLIYWFLKVFSRHLEPQEDLSVWSFLYISLNMSLQTYHIAQSTHTVRTYIQNQIDRIVRIVLCFHCMEKCKYGQLYPFLLLHTSFHDRIPCTDVALGLQCHFIFDIMWSLKNKLICCTEREISCFVLCSVFCTVPLEWRGTHALSPTYKLHNLKYCHAVSSPKSQCFYLGSLRHIILLILSHTACFVYHRLKCSWSPYAFSI